MSNENSSPNNEVSASPPHAENNQLQSQTTDLLTNEQEKLFLAMKSRQLERERAGVKKANAISFHLFVAFASIVVAVLFHGSQLIIWEGSTLHMTVEIDLEAWLWLSVYPFIILVTFDIFASKKWFPAYLLIVIYYPMILLILSWLIYGRTDYETGELFRDILWGVFTVLTIGATLFLHYFYPKWIKSKEFRSMIGAKCFWGIYQVDSNANSWSIAYGGHCCTRRRACQYQGGISQETGRPDGFGEWIDDAGNGESLIGYWRNGVPMAPFRSTVRKSGDVFNAAVLMYYHATDDTFKKNKSKPTNILPARMGIASVECSVQGAFYKHVPEVRLFFDEPITVKDECMESLSPSSNSHVSTTEAIKKCIPYLALDLDSFDMESSAASTDNENLKTSIIISSDDPRGVQVEGHVNEMTGRHCSPSVDKVVVQVVRTGEDGRKKRAGIGRQSIITSMQLAPAKSTYFGRSYDNDISHNNDSEEESKEKVDDGVKDTPDLAATTDTANGQKDELGTSLAESPFHLKVQDWIPVQEKEALVLIPGLANSIAKSLLCFGQFIASTKLSGRIYPVVFGWPTASVVTYRYAAAGANNTRNVAHFLQLMEGLAASGIKRVHFLSHSLGAQSLIAAFTAVDEGKKYSHVSNCFHLSPSFENDKKEEREEKENRMVCKSITLLNPDYPVNEFVNHSFACIRRVCDHITIVGDRNDAVLYYSSVVNGVCNRWKHKNPVAPANARPEQEENQRRFDYELRLGREIESLFLPNNTISSSKDSTDERLLIHNTFRSPATKQYLDIDVIDTTNLDVNLDKVRHSAYNTNPILVRDLEDIILSGRRAKSRPSLLHREGNVYSYSHVPSFVTM
mmetsp:Transcript_26973/g.40956  ORF Transcript_26973/g.40956 Transcript_26973/m.40956 type:complete len:854 (+) Transcript_26973:219-2780(+)